MLCHSIKDGRQGVGFTKIQTNKLLCFVQFSKGYFEFNCVLFKIACPWTKLLSNPINYSMAYALEYESLLPYEIVFVLSTVP